MLSYIRRTILELLTVLQAIDDTLRGILEHLKMIDGSIREFEFPTSVERAPTDEADLTAMSSRIDDLTLAVKEGVNNVQRSERRIRSVVRSAQKELAEHGFEHAGVEAEAGELHGVDGGNSEPEPVPEVPVDVEDDFTPSPIPGITVGEFRRAFSRRR